MSFSMKVQKRDGSYEPISFDKVLGRIRKASKNLQVNPDSIAQHVLARIYDGVKTSEIDELSGQLAASLSTTHPDYGILASRITISNHQKNTDPSFTNVMLLLSNQINPKTKESVSYISQEIIDLVKEKGEEIDAKIDHTRDYLFDYFGFKTLEKSYLMKDVHMKIVERPQHLWMRTSLALWSNDLKRAFETYDYMSQKYFTHATPTLFNAGTLKQQLSSCFIAGTKVHTMDGVKNIENVCIDDEVITHTGSIKKVKQLHTNLLGDRELYTIKIAGTPSMTVTGNHRIWSLSNEQENWGKAPSWNSIDYLRTGDWIAIPNKKFTNSDYILDVKTYLDNIIGDGYNIEYSYEYTDTQVIPSYKYISHHQTGPRYHTKLGNAFNRYWTFDKTMMELLGIWYGDGSVTHEKNSLKFQIPRNVNIVSYNNNIELIEFVMKSFKTIFGISHVTYSQDKHGMVSMVINNTIIAHLFVKIFNCKFDGKRIPKFFNRFSYEHIQYFLAGLVSSDGCVSKTNNIAIQLTNPPLINDIFHLARSVNIPVTVTFMAGKENYKATGRLGVPPNIVNGIIKKHYDDLRLDTLDGDHQWNKVKIINGTTFMRLNIKEICSERPTYVYTLGVDDDHSYSINGIIAENCFLLAMADDSVTGIYKTLADCAQISKHAGGIGVHLHNVRARGSLIKGTNGISNGIMPMLRVFNTTARYIDQCFSPDTLIYTKNGIKCIEDVTVSDKVLTSSGQYCSVLKPVRHTYKGKILNIQIKHSISSVKVTPEHPIYALKGQSKGINYNVIRNRLEKNIVQINFEDAKDLEVGDFIGFSIPTYEKDIASMTKEDCRFYGILLGDGYIRSNIASISVNMVSKINTYTFVIGYLSSRGIHYYEEERENSVQIRWGLTEPNFKFTKSQLYDGNHEKYVEPCMLHLPHEKILKILHGILETDGCVGSKEITLEVTSFNMIESVRYMLLRLGALSSGYDRDRIGNVSSYKNITTKKLTKVLRIPRITEIMELFPNAPQGDCFTFLKHKNMVFSRIDTITEEEYDGILHDFEIDSVHDYTVAHLGLAHNGGGRRNGSFAMYLEPWHADIEDFLRMKQNTGAEEERARDLFYALWIPDLFMKRVESGGLWSLFCPNEAPGLADLVGDEFEALYVAYESEGRARKQISAQKLWFEVLDSQIESGTPYLLYKDAANKKSNQQNLGVIKSSNLCSEIIEYSNAEETAVCNLASIGLPAFIKEDNITHGDSLTFKEKSFDFEKLRKVVRIMTRNLNRVIDINYYPTLETKTSNMRHRPIGMGVQGLADVFAILKISWESNEAAELNKKIFEHMYYAAVEASMEMAKKDGPYSTFTGSPASKGLLQFDLWDIKPSTDLDWEKLKKQVIKHGLRNSLLIAPMPTASTSQILGYNECFEPFTTNIYTRRTLAGEFIIINKYLLKELIELGIWNEDLKQKIVAHNGSIQNISDISESIKPRYKTSWELSQKVLIDMAADRGAYICQSQSLNLFIADPNYAKLTSMHFYGWKKGLKTGCYYLRTKAPVTAQKFTIEPKMLIGNESEEDKKKRERKELLDKLTSEYEEEQKKAKEEADKGDGCLFCSS